ncbi:MAG: hypothetical protein IKC90_01825, partial [Akkermansia sp.]|nr:hypothetical protein [Akkermansia sp.]
DSAGATNDLFEHTAAHEVIVAFHGEELKENVKNRCIELKKLLLSELINLSPKYEDLHAIYI